MTCKKKIGLNQTHLILPVTKVFIYKALKTLLTDVLVHFLQIWKINKGSIKYVQFHGVNCHMTKAV